MQSNPLVTEVLSGLARGGKAQFSYLGLLVLQTAVLFLWWPKIGVAQMLADRHGPHALEAVVIAAGIALAYFALRAGTEEVTLPGQHGLRDWALATPLGLGWILSGYMLGQLIHSLYLLVLSAPLIVAAFTVSGGEWAALGWCLAAALMQALFFRLCGAITHLTIGHHRTESYLAAWAILLLVYIPVGWFMPHASHIALTVRELGEQAYAQPIVAAAADPVAFLAIYAGLGVVATVVLHRLLLRARRGMAGPRGDSAVSAAISS